MRRFLLFPVIACAVAQAALAAGPKAEVQVALCEPHDVLERKLALKPRGSAYQTWLFDDASLSLLDSRVRLRLRSRPDGAELTLKVGGQDCEALPRGAVPKREGKCEFDVYDGKAEGVVSLTTTLKADAARELVAGRLSPSGVLSPSQVSFLRDVVHLWPLPADLRPLGPIANGVYTSGAYDVDLSTLPGGERYAEIGIKVPPGLLDETRRKLDGYLDKAKVTACADQKGQAPQKLRQMLAR